MDGIDKIITQNDVNFYYEPSADITSYSYVIIKDSKYGSVNNVNTNTPLRFVLSESGDYKIDIKMTDINGLEHHKEFLYLIDKEAPIIELKEKTYKISNSEKFDLTDKINAYDNIDGDLNEEITSNIEDIDFTLDGIKRINLSVSDKAGNETNETLYVTVYKDNTNLVRLGQLGIFILVVLFVIFINRYIRSIKYEKRFSKFTINSSKNYFISLFDNLNNQYINFINKYSQILSKSEFIKKISKKYDKYLILFEDEKLTSINLIMKKIIFGFLYLIIIIIINLFRSTIIDVYQMLFSFVIGYYILDIIYIYKYKQYKKDIENDFLNAVTIMNNAFKSGRSIHQAVNLVASELSGPICLEFKKIALELSFGLDVEIAFKRFSERIGLSEAVYLTSSLSVLNNTGGNIIKVFDSIVKTLYDKRKLNQELKSLTSSSRLIMYVLIFVPIVFVIFISLINIGYFAPLFTHPLGIILIFIMLTIYISYIIVVRKALRVG